MNDLYKKNLTDLVQSFGVSVLSGWDKTHVATMREQYGWNKLKEKKSISFFKIFYSQFTSLLVIILIASGIITMFLNEYIDAAFIFLIVILNAIIGAIQEWNAEKSASAIQKLVNIKAKVLREGHILLLNAEELVPGDIVFVESGDKIPADLRWLENNELFVEEALLTGESMPVLKAVDLISNGDLVLGDQINMGFSATTVSSGRGKGLVVAIGNATEIGKIAGQLNELKTNKPPLVKRMEDFSKRISIYTLGLCMLAGLIAHYQGMSWYETFFLVIALAVSAIPEGLPIAITVALSIGSNRMSKQQVVIRKLSAVEGLGSCTVIATDKTGTLTVDQQTMVKMWLPNITTFSFTGVGYSGEGALENTTIFSEETIQQLKQTVAEALLCSEGELYQEKDEWVFVGDPMDVALHAVAYKLNSSTEQLTSAYVVKHKIPFESKHKFSATWVQEDVAHRLIAKGAYEAFEDFLVGDQQEIRQQIHSWAASGYRVLALVQSSTTIESIEMHVEKLPALNLIALMAFVDPIREDVPVAIKECLNAGVDVKMITGDHPATALYIAKQIGIATDEHHVMSGKQLTESIQKNGRLLFDVIKDKSVFARVTPEHKLQIVNVLKENGHYVAVTGDGVNDAPALKSSNIGASMGYGTDVAKEASSMIVLNNSFHSIVSAIKEGRFIYSNIRKVVYLLISTGFAEIFTIIFTLLLQLDIPFTAIQLLWLNLVTNGVQDISLAFEKGDPLEMQKPPRKPSEPMFDKRMLQQVVVSAFVISVAVTVVWYYLLRVNGLGTFESRSIVMLLMVLFQNIHVMNCRNEYLSVFKIPFSNNYILIGAVIFAQLLHILVSHVPFLADVLSLQPYTWTVWWQMTLLSVVILVVMELYKVIAPKPVVNY